MVLEFRKRVIAICFIILASTSSQLFCQANQCSWYDKLVNVKNRLTQIASETIKPDELWKKSKEKNWQFRLPNSVSKSIEKLQELYNNQNKHKHDRKQNKEGLRKFIEFIGEMKLASGSNSLGDYIQQAIDTHCPTLRQTDYFYDPVKAISYYLVLDGKGFIENVKLIRGPLGIPMTLREAYEYYTRTDPEKANKMLIMLEKFQNITNMDLEQGEKLKNLLDALKTNLDLLKISDETK